MRRERFPVYVDDGAPRYVVLWSTDWQLLRSRTVAPGSDLLAAMQCAIAEAACDGWQPESNVDFGFVFLQRSGARRLLMLTPRNPHDSQPQSFNPFRA